MKFTPRDLQDVTEVIDQRITRFASQAARIEYGTVASINAAGNVAALYIAGSTAMSDGFRVPPAFGVAVGDTVRATIVPSGDRYITENLTAHRGSVAPGADLLAKEAWLTGGGTIAASAGVDFDFDASLRVTYPGNPAMAGHKVLIAVYAEVSVQSAGVGEWNVSVMADIAPDGRGTRLTFTRDRFDAANTWNFTHAESQGSWDADQAVEFRVMGRHAVSTTITPYANASADYVTRIGYRVVGYH